MSATSLGGADQKDPAMVTAAAWPALD